MISLSHFDHADRVACNTSVMLGLSSWTKTQAKRAVEVD
jgi:hypothetical protein